MHITVTWFNQIKPYSSYYSNAEKGVILVSFDDRPPDFYFNCSCFSEVTDEMIIDWKPSIGVIVVLPVLKDITYRKKNIRYRLQRLISVNTRLHRIIGISHGNYWFVNVLNNNFITTSIQWLKTKQKKSGWLEALCLSKQVVIKQMYMLNRTLNWQVINNMAISNMYKKVEGSVSVKLDQLQSDCRFLSQNTLQKFRYCDDKLPLHCSSESIVWTSLDQVVLNR